MPERTSAEREFLATIGFSIMLTWIAEDPHIELIKKVFLKSTLTPQDIVAEAKKKLHLIGDSSYVIYEHIQYALYRDMKENPDSSVIDAMYQTAYGFIAMHLMAYTCMYWWSWQRQRWRHTRNTLCDMILHSTGAVFSGKCTGY